MPAFENPGSVQRPRRLVGYRARLVWGADALQLQLQRGIAESAPRQRAPFQGDLSGFTVQGPQPTGPVKRGSGRGATFGVFRAGFHSIGLVHFVGRTGTVSTSQVGHLPK